MGVTGNCFRHAAVILAVVLASEAATALQAEGLPRSSSTEDGARWLVAEFDFGKLKDKLKEKLKGKKGEAEPAASAPGAEGDTVASEPTAAERQMRDDRKQYASIVAGGAAIGATVGGIGCAAYKKLKGDKTEDALKTGGKCALIGGALGGVLGAGVAHQNQEGQKELRSAQETTEKLKQDNQKLQAVIDSSSTVLAEGMARLAKINEDLAAKRISTRQADQARAREVQNIATMQGALDDAKKAQAAYQEAAAKVVPAKAQDKSKLDAEIAALSQKVAKLEANVAEYNKALAVSKA